MLLLIFCTLRQFVFLSSLAWLQSCLPGLAQKIFSPGATETFGMCTSCCQCFLRCMYCKCKLAQEVHVVPTDL